MGQIEFVFLVVGVCLVVLAAWALSYARRKLSEDNTRQVSEAPNLQPTATTVADALSQTRKSFSERIRSLFSGPEVLNPSDLEALEEILYTSDVGPQTVQRLLTAVREKINGQGLSFDQVRAALRNEITLIFSQLNSVTADSVDARIAWAPSPPTVILVVGVNGAGKTTTIGKLASQLSGAGKKVLIAAGDTFRAAAGEQLKVWSDRAQVEIFDPPGVSDPSAVAFSACDRALSQGFDTIIIDTAGRLHTQKNLMEELKKVKRVIGKKIALAPHEVLLVLDASSGQNALIQAREFHQALGVTGVVLTKLDGTAKGGVAIGVAGELGLPVKLIGIGEKLNDLRVFQPKEFIENIL